MTEEQLAKGKELQYDINRHRNIIEILLESEKLANKLTITFANTDTTFNRTVTYYFSDNNSKAILETIIGFLLSEEESETKNLREEFDNL